ncbi:MAG: hypothetical protein QMC78_03975 [Methanocellales archaeon]|nr:hypothetical protein [Methanocellales archaeon]
MRILPMLRSAVELDRIVNGAYEKAAVAFLWFVLGPVTKLDEMMYEGYAKAAEHFFHTGETLFYSLRRPN